jgi:hypothetical protein
MNYRAATPHDYWQIREDRSRSLQLRCLFAAKTSTRPDLALSVGSVHRGTTVLMLDMASGMPG